MAGELVRYNVLVPADVHKAAVKRFAKKGLGFSVGVRLLLVEMLNKK